MSNLAIYSEKKAPSLFLVGLVRQLSIYLSSVSLFVLLKVFSTQYLFNLELVIRRKADPQKF